MTDSSKPLDFNAIPGAAATTPPPPHFKPLTRVHTAVAILAAISFWSPLLWGIGLGIKDYAKFGEGVGRMLVFFAITVGIVALIDRWTRRWSRWPAVVVLLVISSLVGWVGFAAMSKARDTVLARKLDTLLETSLSGLQSLDPRTTTREDRLKATAQATEQLRALAATMPPRVVGMNLVFFDQTAAIYEAVIPYNTLIQQLNERGGIDPASMKSREEVESRLTLLTNAATEQAKYLAFLEDMRDDLVRRCEAAGIDTALHRAKIDQFVAKAAGQGSIGLELNQLEGAILKSQIDYLIVLRDSWGAWTMEDGLVTFSGPNEAEHVRRFNDAFDTMQRHSQRQQQLRQLAFEQKPGR